MRGARSPRPMRWARGLPARGGASDDGSSGTRPSRCPHASVPRSAKIPRGGILCIHRLEVKRLCFFSPRRETLKSFHFASPGVAPTSSSSVLVSSDRMQAASLPDEFVQVDTVFITVSNFRSRCQLLRVGRMSNLEIFRRTTSAIGKGEVLIVAISVLMGQPG